MYKFCSEISGITTTIYYSNRRWKTQNIDVFPNCSFCMTPIYSCEILVIFYWYVLVFFDWQCKLCWNNCKRYDWNFEKMKIKFDQTSWRVSTKFWTVFGWRAPYGHAKILTNSIFQQFFFIDIVEIFFYQCRV